MKCFTFPQEARCQNSSVVKLGLCFCLWQVMKGVSLSDLESHAPKNSKKVPRGAERRTIWRGREGHSGKNKLALDALSANSYRPTLCSFTRQELLDNGECGLMPHLHSLLWKGKASLYIINGGEEINLKSNWEK